MGVQKQYILYNLLINGSITGSELTTILSQADYATEYQKLLAKKNYAYDIANNQLAIDIINSSVSGIFYASNIERFVRESMLNSTTARKLILNSNFHSSLTNATKDILKDIVSDTKYKLRRDIYRTVGAVAWNVAPSGIIAASVVCIGGGSSGGSTNGSANGKTGGGGAEITITTFPSGWPTGPGLPAGTHNIFVGAGGNGVEGNGSSIGGASSSIYSYEMSGNIASANGGNGSTGGGTTASGGVSSITNTDFLNAIWQLNSCKVKGGDGGAPAGGVGQGNGIGTGGAAGTSTTGGQPGTAYGGGGGGGLSNGGGAAANAAGASAAANSGAGGGGCTVLSAAATMTGGSGGSGLVVVHYVVL